MMSEQLWAGDGDNKIIKVAVGDLACQRVSDEMTLRIQLCFKD